MTDNLHTVLRSIRAETKARMETARARLIELRAKVAEIQRPQ